MKKRYLIGGFVLLLAIGATIALAYPGSPLYLPEIMVSSSMYEDRSASSWARDLSSPEPEVRGKAAFALSNIGEPAGKTVPTLATMLTDDQDSNVRAVAAFALGRIGKPSVAAVPALIKGLSDEEALVRFNCANTIRLLGPDARDAVPALLKSLLETRNEVYPDKFILTIQDAIALAIANVTKGSDVGVEALMEALKATQLSPTRKAVVRSLGEIGPAAKSAVPLITEFKADKDRLLRETVEISLKQIAGEE